MQRKLDGLEETVHSVEEQTRHALDSLKTRVSQTLQSVRQQHQRAEDDRQKAEKYASDIEKK